MLYEVEILRQCEQLLAIYRDAFKARYILEPVSRGDQSDQAIVKDLIRQVGRDKLETLILHYLTMSDEFFLSRGHDLHTLKKCLPSVNASMGTKLSHMPKGTHILLCDLSCDICGAQYQDKVTVKDFSKPLVCHGCRDKECPF